MDADVAHSMAGVQLGEAPVPAPAPGGRLGHAPYLSPQQRQQAQHVAAAGPQQPQQGGPATALLVVDRWLRLRLPAAVVAPLMCVRVRLAEAFAAAVRRPRHPLDPPYAGGLALFAL